MIVKNNDSGNDFELELDEIMQAFLKKPIEHKDAWNFCKELADEGNPRAMLWLARIYRNGIGVEKNVSMAIDYSMQSADGGEKYAVNELLLSLIERGGDEDIKKAFDIASDFPKYNNAGLAVHLARMYHNGIGTTKDLDESIRYMKIAYNRGHDVAKRELIDLLLERKKRYDLELAVTILNELGEHGSDLYRRARVIREPESIMI